VLIYQQHSHSSFHPQCPLEEERLEEESITAPFNTDNHPSRMKTSVRALASHVARPESFIVASKRTPFGAFGGK
jgi:hypothetical protein